MFLELSSWPTLNFDGDPGSCPFDAKKQDEIKLIYREVKENKRDIESINKAEVHYLLLYKNISITISSKIILFEFLRRNHG